jgi:hypothetical protein
MNFIGLFSNCYVCILILIDHYFDSGNCHQSQQISSFRHSNLRSSTPIKEDKERILTLEQEVQTLRLMVHELWVCHQAAISSSELDCTYMN